MPGAVQDDSALRAYQGRPARGVAPLLWRGVAPRSRSVHGQEIDREADRSERLDVVINPRRDALLIALPQIDLQYRLAGQGEPEMPLLDADPAPGPRPHTVAPAQPGRHGVLVPHRTGPHNS